MINQQLMNPRSIVVVGASNDISKPGGKVLYNLIEGGFQGKLYASNPKEDEIQGITCTRNLNDLPQTDLAILAIAAKHALSTVEFLIKEKNTRAFIVLSAGFSEESAEGKQLEKQLVEVINAAGASLIGPNCIGILTPHHHSVFTRPIPKLDPKGCDFISGSGATAVFIMEAGIPKGLTFASVFSVGNSAQLGVEEVLEYLDETFDPQTSSRVKLLYIENIAKPEKLLRHASSLIRKGCRIAAIKAGASEAGSRAASSHTGALASSDVAVQALFRKAGIVRCHGREELISVASVFMHPLPAGRNFAVITHAGGPAVMLTDALSEAGLKVPHIESPAAQNLLQLLYPGSSVANPIDFLATGTAEQLGHIIDYCETQFSEIDAMAVIFGTPGLFRIDEVYAVLHEKMTICSKPIYPVLPSTLTAAEEVESFLSKGRINFPDEVTLGRALGKVMNCPAPSPAPIGSDSIDYESIRNIIARSVNGYLSPEDTGALLDAAGIPRVKELVVQSQEDAFTAAQQIGFPLVMKVVGPVHKSDIGGVKLNIRNDDEVRFEFQRMMKIQDATGILMQPMLQGAELFIGAKREGVFGHLVMAGLGGIFIEVFKDVHAWIAPLASDEALEGIRGLKAYPIIKGARGQAGIDELAFADAISKVSQLVTAAPEIFEMDINPLLGKGSQVLAVDARIRIEKDQ
jgi:acetate---CoA ligase (ADP-forming)